MEELGIPGVTKIGDHVCHSCNNLTTVNAPDVEQIGAGAFYDCTALTSFKAHRTKRISGSAFWNVTLDALVFPNLTQSDNGSFRRFLGTKIDLDGEYSCKPDWMRECYNLNTLIFRKKTIVVMSTMFSNTPFNSGGSGGTIYIPKTLYDHLGDGTSLDYKAATNWSTMDGYGTITWAKIEGSQYEHYYADGTQIPSS